MSFVKKEKYHIAIKIIHWLMAFIIIGLIAAGLYMEGLPDNNPIRSDLYSLHKSFGVLVLLLAFLRVVLKIKIGGPDLPGSLPLIIRNLAKLTHHMLYLFMFAVPIAGIAMSNMYGYPVKMFGMELPKIFSTNKDLAGIAHSAHWILAYILVAILVAHIAGAIKHRFFEKNPKNDVLNRML